jgi:phosphoribosylanthranilate isomerase
MKLTKFWDKSTEQIKIKACGISNIRDAVELAKMGYDALGFHFFKMRDSEETIYNYSLILEKIPSSVTTVLLIAFKNIENILLIIKRLRFDTLQLYSDLSINEIVEIKNVFKEIWNSDLKILKVISAKSEENILPWKKFIKKYEAIADGFLVDSSKYGGSGQTHDWAFTSNIIENTSRPVILAGGLNLNNIYTAINTVHPYGVDVETGIRRVVNGVKKIDLDLASQLIGQLTLPGSFNYT